MKETATKLIEKQCQRHLINQGIITKEKFQHRLQEIFEQAEHQEAALIGLYKMLIPDWERIERLEGYPVVGRGMWKYIANLFIDFDQRQPSQVLQRRPVAQPGLFLQRNTGTLGNQHGQVQRHLFLKSTTIIRPSGALLWMAFFHLQQRRFTMTNTTTLENVINTVRQDSINHFDEVMPVHEMEFDSLQQMWISGKQVDVAPTAQRLLSNRLRVPYSYLSRCPEDLQAPNLNFWIEQERRRRDTFFCRFDGSTLRAVFTERYKPLDNMEILAQLIEQGFNHNLKVQYSLDHGMFLLKIPEFEKAFGVNSGNGFFDEVVPGIAFSNSEVGLIAFSIESFFYRLVCTNGLISVAKAKTSRFKHISNKGLENFPEALSAVIEGSSRNQEDFKLSCQSHVDDPFNSIDVFSRRFGLSQNEADIVKKSFEQESGNTLFHIINAFTASAKVEGLATADVYKFEKAGGQILSLVKS